MDKVDDVDADDADDNKNDDTNDDDNDIQKRMIQKMVLLLTKRHYGNFQTNLTIIIQ